MLGEIGAGASPSCSSLNKVDLLSEHERARVLARFDGGAVAGERAHRARVSTSCMTAIEAAVPRFPVDVTLLVPWGREDVTAMLHRDAEVLSEDAAADGTLVHARVNRARARRGRAVPRRARPSAPVRLG